MNKRHFLKSAGLGLAATTLGCSTSNAPDSASSPGEPLADVRKEAEKIYRQKFNMSGYEAPKIDVVRIGYIGLGNRGAGAINRITHLANVEVKALCDLDKEKCEMARQVLSKTSSNPEIYSGGPDEWKKLCERDDIDLVYLCTPWSLHTPMAIYAMESGKHAAVEVPAANTLKECYALVETSEKTKKHCMMLENCCYDFFELLTLNMARSGYFGDLVHAEGAYLHALSESLISNKARKNHWRLIENLRNGNLYPTHGLGPIAQILDINRGDKMDLLVSMSSNDFTLGKMVKEQSSANPEIASLADKDFGGNMNTSIIRTNKGRTIMLQHDVYSPQPYSRIHKISGTKAYAQKYPLPGKIARGEEWIGESEMLELEKKFQPMIVKKIGEMAKKVGGHGGMDFLMDWRLIDCLRNGLALDQDVYDAAAWSAVAPLSEWSVANKSNSIPFPDFTGGSWKTNAPVDISMSRGGNTRVIS